MSSSAGTEPAPRPIMSWRDWAFLGLIMAIGSGLTLLAGSSLQQTEALRLQERKTASTQAITSALDLELARITEAIRSAGLMLESHPQLSRDQFNRYMQKLVEGQLSVNLMEWQPIVPANRLAQFELAARMAGQADFRVVQPNDGGTGWEPVHGRDEYVPVLFAWPEQYRTAGLDLSFSPERMASKLKSKSLAQPVASGVFEFIKEGAVKSGTQAIAISTAVFGADRMVTGYLAAVVDLPTLFQKAGSLAEAGKLDFLVFSSAAPDAEPIYARLGDDSDLKQLTTGLRPATAGDQGFSADLAHQAMTIVIHPRPAFYADSPMNVARLAFAAGTFMTLLLLVIVGVSLRLNARLRIESSSRSMSDKALQRSRELLERTGTMAKVGGWEFDLHTGKISWTFETYRIHEIDPAVEPELTEAINFYAPQARPLIRGAVQAAIDNGTPYDLEVPFVAASGRQKWVRTQCVPVLENGKAICLQGSFQDITERKEAEAALQRIKTMMERTESMARLASFEWDVDANVVTWSPEMFRIFGRDPAQGIPNLEGQTELYTPESAQTLFEAVGTAVTDGVPYELELMTVQPDGERRPCYVKGFPERDGFGRVVRLAGLLQDITERKRTEDEVKSLAFYDPLTRLPNRRLLLDRLKHAVATSARRKHYGALLFIDLDNFKNVNDTLGHNIGDLLLQQVAQRLTICVREGDTVGRLGGDEFVVMLENLSDVATEAASETETVGEKILALLNLPYQLGSHRHHSTPSIGVTLFVDHQGTVDDLLQRADLAMYRAKAAGRNTVRFFDQEMQTVVMARAALERDLREAIEQNRFVLYFQPQVNEAGELTGAETLVRWQHPERGLVSPTEFIALAEDSGLILPLGHWVLKTACEQLAAWSGDTNMAELSIAVNVSSRQFMSPKFVEEVCALLDCTGANPRRLKLELTESMLLADVDDTIAKMKVLKTKGVGFSLDDFGTGYSSLSYLKRLPLDQFKIDQSFVRNILTDSNDLAIATMIVGLAKNMGLEALAEGVEVLAQRDTLFRLGCHAYQGYLFSPPLPVDLFEQFCAAR